MMNARAGLVVLLGLCNCVHADRIALGAATLSVGCDWTSTRRAAQDGWVDRSERNPWLGPTPSVTAVDNYFIKATAVGVVAWSLLPRRWRLPVAIAVLAIETVAVIGNVDERGLCGI